MTEPLPLPLTVAIRGLRTLIVPATAMLGAPLLEVLPYMPGRSTVRVAAAVATLLNFHPRAVHVLRLIVKEYDKSRDGLTNEQRFAAAEAAALLNLIDGK